MGLLRDRVRVWVRVRSKGTGVTRVGLTRDRGVEESGSSRVGQGRVSGYT